MRRSSGVMSKLLLLPFAFIGCLSSSMEEPPGPPTPELFAAYGHDVELSCELHRALTAGGPGANAFFSPASIAAALSMVAEGARGVTQIELAQALQRGDELDLDALRAVRADLAHRLRAASGDIRWNEANGIWVDDQATLVEATQHALREHHDASIEPANFRGASDDVRQGINAWVETQTQDRIKDLLPGGSVHAMTRLVLVNAVHFLGKWEEKFEKGETRDRPFRRADGTEVAVPFLLDWRKLPVAFFDAEDNVQPTDREAALTVFELPYQGGQLSFVGLIPASETGLLELEQRLSATQLKQWLGALRARRVDFAMPKLKLEPSYDLVPVLKHLGLGSMLDPGTADLSGFFGKSDGLCITGAFHKAFLNVDEAGTEAAAATGLVVGVTSAAGPLPKVHADRPYLFLIRERTTGAILFMGRIMNP